MADMLNFDPKFYNSLDALNRGSQDVNVLAQQRAAALLSQINANRRNEEIDSELAYKKALADTARLREEAYSKQVDAQQASVQNGKPFDRARAESEKLRNLQPVLASIYHQYFQDPAEGADAYNTLSSLDMFPESWKVGESKEPQTHANSTGRSVMSRFNPEFVRGIVMGADRPNNVAKQEIEDSKQTGLTGRNDASIASREREGDANRAVRREAIAAQVKAAAERARAAGQDPRKLAAEYQSQADQLYNAAKTLSGPQRAELEDKADQLYEAAIRAARISAISSPGGAGTELDITKAASGGGIAEKPKVGSTKPTPKEFNYVPGKGLVPVE